MHVSYTFAEAELVKVR